MTTPTVPTTLTADNRTLGTYISDMMALERHLDEAFERQESFTKDYPEAHEMILQLISTTRNHIMVLDRRIKELNEKTFTDSLKSAIAGLFGVAAGVVDAIRPLHISKALRDDYTAMNHAIVGYVMLQTTASALNDQTTLKIADDFLRDYLRLTQLVIGIIPSITLKDLESSGVPIVNRSAPKQVTSNKQFSMLFNPSQGLSTTVSGGR